MSDACTVELSSGEVALAAALADMRQGENRRAGIQNLKAGPQDPITTELVGVFAEFAFAQWANVYPDLTTHLRSGSHDAMYRGWRVDVKGTRSATGPLYVYGRPDKQADIYVLVHVNYASCRIVGWLAPWWVQHYRIPHVVKEHALVVGHKHLSAPDTLRAVEPGHA